MEVAASIGGIILIGCERRERNSHEVHKVIARKCHGEREGAEQHHYLKHVYLQEVEQLHQHGERHQRHSKYQHRVVVDPCLELGGHDGKILNPLKQHEIDNGGTRHTAKQSHLPFQPALVFKRENQSRQKLHHRSKHKRYSHRQEDTQNHRQRFLSIDKIAHGKSALGSGDLEKSHHKRCAKKLKHHRHRGGRGHTERVKHIKQYDVSDHHSHEYRYNIIERQILRMKNAMPRHVHHAIAHRRADKHAYRRDNHDPLERCRLRADSR